MFDKFRKKKEFLSADDAIAVLSDASDKVKTAMELLKYGNYEVRGAVASEVARLGIRAVGVWFELANTLGDPFEEVRMRSAKAFWKLEGVDYAIRSLRDEYENPAHMRKEDALKGIRALRETADDESAFETLFKENWEDYGRRPSFKHYVDSETGFSFDYPNLAGWTIQKPPQVRAPARLIFVNHQLKATLVFAFVQLPNVIPDLSGPGIFDAVVTDIFGSYRRSNPGARLLSSRLVTNPKNSVKGAELVYTDKVRGELWKGRLTAFFKGSKRYDVTAFALQENFDHADREFCASVLTSFNF